MAVKIRLSRGGSKKRPYYHIVVADERAPRDGRYIERLGFYNPMQPKDSDQRIKFDAERVKYWLDTGAQPTDRISRFLEQAGIVGKKERNNPNKGKPHAKTLELQREKEEKRAAAEEAAKQAEEEAKAAEEAAKAEAEQAVETPAEEAPSEDAAPAAEAEAPAEDAKPEEVAAEEENKDAAANE